ncbi:MAG: hypothetical protein ACRD6N_07195 [Pyrinomonadaceae bacterium]
MKRKVLITAALSLVLLFCMSATYTGATATHTGQNLVGTWAVTLRFPECTTACPCPGNIPNIPIPALHMYSNDGTMEEMSGGTLIRSDALGSWEHVRDHEYSARYKFFIFSLTNGARIQTEVITSEIELQGHDAFAATATFDLFAADGITPISTRCPINISATRF